MLQEKILEILKGSDNYVSGEEISSHLKVSRQALWKHIQELKNAGYDIVAVPHLGYQLLSSPDRLFAQEAMYNLNTKFVGKKIEYFDSVSSTMDIAWQQGMCGLPEGAMVLAETQTKGRGRLGRGWTSPKYKGIYLSLILRPQISPAEAPLFTIFSAVGICEAIKEVTGLDTQIKWPNDILIRQKKIGGILTELNAEMDQVYFLVIGIGINVNNDKKTLPLGATSLKEEKNGLVNRRELLQEILRKIEANYLVFQKKGSQAIIQKWCDHNITLGRRVRVFYHQKQLEGEAVDIAPDGGLLIRKDSGLVEKVSAGDVVHC